MNKVPRTFSFLGRRSLISGMLLGVAPLLMASQSPDSQAAESIADETTRLLAEFKEYSGSKLVFDEDDLPRGQYHDIMVPLGEKRRRDAAEICLREVKKYPPGYLGEMKLEAIGIFAACASRAGDGYREFDREIGGYRYYGIWNGKNGIAGAYYSDGQLPLTFHHEVFHHVDGTHAGVTDASRYFESDDRQFANAIDGTRRYEALAINGNDLQKLKRIRNGYVLKGAVSSYASKTRGEDQAETARHFLTSLPDALVQMAEQPELPGSQRMLHCLTQYYAATDGDADPRWFVNVALGRQSSPREAEVADSGVAPASATKALPPTIGEIITQLREYSRPGETGWDGVADREEQARQALASAASLDLRAVTPRQADHVALAAAAVSHRLLRYRLQAAGNNDQRYAVHGREDADGVNWTLRRDIKQFGDDALVLKKIARHAPKNQDLLLRTQLQNLRLVARFYAFIDANWSVTGGTKQAFEQTRDAYADALPASQSTLAVEIRRTGLNDLARRLRSDGSPKLEDISPERPRLLPLRRDNAFLVNVDREVRDADRRLAIRQVQPACVRFSNGSGTCISPDGLILTAGHVAKTPGRKLSVAFPDGKVYVAKCTAVSDFLDLAVLKIDGANDLPYAPLSPKPAEVGTWICAIGQPGSRTPSGEATGYGAFHVSTGQIRGFKRNRLGDQSLGGVKHDAWTYWGHSGCPLFNADGEIVAIHNSWDSTTAMRHGVTHEAIMYFLKEAKAEFALAE